MKSLAILLSLSLIFFLADCQRQQNISQNSWRRLGIRRHPLNHSGLTNNNDVGPIGPPQQPVSLQNVNNNGMPGLRPPKGVAEQLNRAKLKDFMKLGQNLLQRRLHA